MKTQWKETTECGHRFRFCMYVCVWEWEWGRDFFFLKLCGSERKNKTEKSSLAPVGQRESCNFKWLDKDKAKHEINCWGTQSPAVFIKARYSDRGNSSSLPLILSCVNPSVNIKSKKKEEQEEMIRYLWPMRNTLIHFNSLIRNNLF